MTKAKVICCICVLIAVIAIICSFFNKDLGTKTIVFVGDSLMDGYENDYHSFEYYFKKYIPNANMYNFSKSGSTISDNTGGEMSIINQVKSIKGCYPDLIVLDGGANDIISYGIGTQDKSLMKDIGTINYNSNEMSNSDSVVGDFEEIIVEIKNKFPEAKIVYLQMFLIDDDTIDNITLDGEARPLFRKRRDELFPQIKNVCEKRGVTYIDVSHKLTGSGSKYRQDDYIHINQNGYIYLTPFVMEKLAEVLNS